MIKAFSLAAVMAAFSFTCAPAQASDRIEIIARVVAGYCMYQEGYFDSREDSIRYVMDQLLDKGYSARRVRNVVNANASTLDQLSTKCDEVVR